MPLTEIAVRNAKARAKPARLFDAGGLYLEIAPSGGKWWRFKYRFAEKEKRLSLGVYPEVSLKAARAKRDEARRLLGDGIDPSEHRQQSKSALTAKTANSFEAIAREWFAKFSENWVDTHSSKILRRLERDLFPWLGAAHQLDRRARAAERAAPD